MIAHSSFAVGLLSMAAACFVGPSRWEWSERQETEERGLWHVAVLILALTLGQVALAILYPEAGAVIAASM